MLAGCYSSSNLRSAIILISFGTREKLPGFAHEDKAACRLGVYNALRFFSLRAAAGSSKWTIRPWKYLRQQVEVLKRKCPNPVLNSLDRLFDQI